jgi:hypothetical protein|tara:strand:+ start:567 stop:1079 length:513 start_codon:yes stop_codon:yes gene_type:complete
MEHVYYETNFNVEEYRNDLLQEYLGNKDNAELYQYESGNIRWPMHSHYSIISKNIPVAQTVADKFEQQYGIKCYPKYYILDKGYILDAHKDAGTQASFNYILSEDNDPLIFTLGIEDVDIEYSKGLLNLQQIHRVPQSKNKRIILKLSIYDDTFSVCKRKIKDYENSNLR